MRGKKNKKSILLSLLLRRGVVAVLIAAMLFGLIPDIGRSGLNRVEAGSIYDNIVLGFISINMSEAANFSMIDEEMVNEAIKVMHEAGSSWGDVRLAAVMEYLGDKIADTVTVGETTKQVNPWTDESVSSNGSPYRDSAVDFNGNAMNTEYTLGQLILDYLRSTETSAILFEDEEIMEMYDVLAGDDDGNPLVDYDQLLSALRSAASSAGMGSYEAQDASAQEAVDTSNLTTYGEYITRNGILPGGWLFIGTWLMDAKEINAVHYRAAVQSMSDYNQQIMLYRSELSGNSWKDISGATGLSYILPIAENVSEKTMLNYFVSVVVGSDGIAIDAKSGNTVDIFSITDPYNLKELPEFKSLKLQFDAGVVDDPDSLSKQFINGRIKDFFNRTGAFERNANMERDCQYVLDVAGRTGIAFYAADPFYCTSSTAWREREGRFSWFFSYVDGISSTGGYHKWRYEESGRGFLESIERGVDFYLAGRRSEKFNYRWDYLNEYRNWRTPEADWDQQERLIRGSISWRNEVAWRDEVNAFGGIEELRNRIWNFQDVWAHYSCVRDEVTDDLDKKLAAMNQVYVSLRQTGRDEDKELADEAMLIAEKIDAARRARAYYNMIENDKHNYVVGPVLNLLYEWVTTGESHVGTDFRLFYHTDEDFTPVESITEAVENAITSCQSSYIKYSSMAIGAGGNITSQTEYDLMNYVIDNGNQGREAVRSQLRDLVDLENVRNGVIAHKSRELNFLNEMIPVGDTKFSLYVHQSAGEDYLEAASDPLTSQEVLDEYLQDQKADLSAVAAELQSFIRAKSQRLDTESAIAFIEDRINWADGMYAGISIDAFGPYAKEGLDEHINWLKELLASIKEGGEIYDEASQLEIKKAELEKQRLDALDNNDLKAAEDIGRKIEDVQEALDDANADKNRMAASGTATAAELANAETSNTPRAVANKIADEALEKISDKQFDDIPDAIEALETLGSPRLEEVVEALEIHGASVKLINQAKEALSNIGESSFADEYPELDGTGTGGTGTGTGNVDGDGSGGTGNGAGTGTGGNGAGTGTGENGAGGDGTGGVDGDGSGGTGNGAGTGTGGTGTGGNGAGGNGTGGNGTGGNGAGGDGTGGGGTGTGENGNGGNGTGGNGAGGNGTGGNGAGGNGTGGNGAGGNGAGGNGTGGNGTGGNGTGGNGAGGNGTGGNGAGGNGAGGKGTGGNG
ncbi:MAG: hypothetical protein IJM34_02360, partial [Lachnospiraceae bacterium]|nr:hypothetical protein [Lachnospiraceae bacterium]